MPLPSRRHWFPAFLLLALSAGGKAAMLLNQVGDTNAYVFASLPDPTPSQIFPDFPEFNCLVLEDFFSNPSDLKITHVSVLLRAEGGFGSFQDVQGFSVNFFSDVDMASGSLTGNVASLMLDAGSGASVTRVMDGSGMHDYGLVDLELDVSLPSAGRYWIGVAPVASSSVAGQFFVQTSGTSIPEAANARLANPGLGFGGDSLTLLGSHYAYSVTTVPEPGITLLAVLSLYGGLFSRRMARLQRRTE